MKKIGLCALSHVATHERYDEVVQAMKSQGYECVLPQHFYNDDRVFLPSIETRIEDFNALLHRGDLALINFSGGDGCIEILPGIDYAYFKRHPTPVMGYSDATFVLNALYAKTGQIAYYGPGTGVFVDGCDYNYAQVKDLICQGTTTHLPLTHHKTMVPGTAEGILVGGYLGIFNLLLGSRYNPLRDGTSYIVFLEDHYFYHDLAGLSSELSYLTQHPLSSNIKAIIFGNYGRDDALLDQRLKELGEALHIPVMQTNDFGHEEHHAIFPIGKKARVNTVEGTIAFID